LSRNVTMCREFEQFAQTNCLFMVAILNSDISICEELPESLEINCKAIVDRDPSLCRKPENKDSCYSHYAKFTGDLFICDMIEDSSSMNSCVGNAILNNPTLATCKLLEDDIMDSCISRVVHLKQDLSLCNEMKDEEARKICLLDRSVKS